MEKDELWVQKKEKNVIEREKNTLGQRDNG